jgi:hypothetical protein
MKSPASGLPKKTGFRSIAATASRAMEWFKALLAHEKPLEGLV